jgi:hypothetical protein
MLASIVISALLAGPAVTGLIPRQNTVITIRHTETETVTKFPTSTVFAYSPAGNTTILPFVPSGTASGVSGGVTIAPGLNPINGMPAAPPVRPSNKTEVAKSSTTIKPIVFTSMNGRLTAIYKSGPASTFAIPLSSSSRSTITRTSTRTVTTTHKSASTTSSADTSMPISFHTFSATKGVKVTATNSPSADSSTSTSSIARASSSSYSALAQAPPQPTIVSRGSNLLNSLNAIATQTTTKSRKTAPKSRKPAPSTRTWSVVKHPHPTATAAPPPPPPASFAPGPPSFATPKPTSTKDRNPYPYPTKEPPKPKSSPTKWHYPYPSNY